MKALILVVCFLLLISFVSASYSIEPVVIEFLYYEPPCPACHPEYHEIYLRNRQIVVDIQHDYISKVSVEWIPFFTEGLKKLNQYGINIYLEKYRDYWNTIVINYERIVKGCDVDKTSVREIIDAYLTDSVHDVSIIKVMPSNSMIEVGEKINITVTAKNIGIETESFNVNTYCNESLIGTQLVTDLGPKHEFSMIFVWDTTNQTLGNYVIKAEAEPVLNETNIFNNLYVYSGKIKVIQPPSSDLLAFIGMLAGAFLLGFFETFSPCLIILLSFVLSYTLSEEPYCKESFLKVMIFGIGFVFAALLLGIAFGLFFFSVPTLQYSLTWIVCIFAVIFGLNLLGLLKAPFQTKPLIKKLARKSVTYAGLLLLGFTFYFLDPCIAPILVTMLPLLTYEALPLVLFVFCLGAIIPFFGIGIFAGSV